MKPTYIFIGIIFSLLYAGVNYYIGLRGWQALGSKIPFLNGMIYWVLFWLIAFSYIITMLVGKKYLPTPINRVLTYTGSYWLGALYYFIMLVVLLDLLRSVGRWTGLLPAGLRTSAAGTFAGAIVFLIVLFILVYGTWNARNPVVTQYNIDIDKKAGSLDKLHIVMVSDVHLGTIMDRSRLQLMVDRITSLKPDLILFAGDVVDDDLQIYRKANMAEVFKQLSAPYGIYAVPGNHEYFSGNIDDVAQYLEECGIQVLRDRCVKVTESFYVVGRDDVAGKRFTHKDRLDIPYLLKDADLSLPILLMDHQPVALDKAQQAAVDLQVSGHTHRGQMFPNSLITKRTFEVDWGHLVKGNTHIIVSNGFGTWGPPLRIGSRSEIVDIQLNFKK